MPACGEQIIRPLYVTYMQARAQTEPMSQNICSTTGHVKSTCEQVTGTNHIAAHVGSPINVKKLNTKGIFDMTS